MKLLLSYLRNTWPLVALALLLATISQVFSLLDPLILRHVIDGYATRFQEYSTGQFFRGVSLLLGAAVGVAFVSRVAKNFQDYFISVITQRLGAQIYSDGIRHSLELPYSVFEDQRSGETLGKLQKVRTDVEKLITSAINVLFTSLVGILFVVVYAFSVHWIIAPAYFLTVPLLGVLSSILSRKIKTIQKVIVAETTALAGSTTESLRNIELVKSLGLAQQEIARLNSTTDKILQLELKKVRYIRSLSFIQGTTVNLLRTSIMFLMLYLIFTRAITVGQFFSLFIYSFFIFGPLQELGNIINVYREAEVSLKNFQDILHIPKEPRPSSPVPVPELHHLAFEDVSFMHQSAASPAVSGISFEVGRGDTIAFVGPSGAGKTTLVKLLVGLYQPRSGAILYNGHRSTTVDLDQLRERIGFVTQETQLFSGTIRENLLFVNPAATDDECLAVLRKAACQSLLARADRGLDTVIGEGGIKVSGGEKQRLSIARALLRQPHLIVFDEATSSLDSLTEEEISETIRDVAVSQDVITILIAHRLSTIMHADRIFVLERGRIVESGPHDALLAQKGLYYAMWRQQIGERRSATVVPMPHSALYADSGAPHTEHIQWGMPYPEFFVAPMREELARLGIEELRTAGDVDKAISGTPGTLMIVVNSICGCAAGRARPGVAMALRHTVVPDRVASVFAGFDVDATGRARAYFSGHAPSSPSIGLFRGGSLVYMLERGQIETRDAGAIAAELAAAFDRFCGAYSPTP